jgi:hypothetical protein
MKKLCRVKGSIFMKKYKNEKGILIYRYFMKWQGKL